MAHMLMKVILMSNLSLRIKKMDEALAEIGYDDEFYIEAMIEYYRGDEGKALSLLPRFRASRSKFAGICINALSRIENDNNRNLI